MEKITSQAISLLLNDWLCTNTVRNSATAKIIFTKSHLKKKKKKIGTSGCNGYQPWLGPWTHDRISHDWVSRTQDIVMINVLNFVLAKTLSICQKFVKLALQFLSKFPFKVPQSSSYSENTKPSECFYRCTIAYEEHKNLHVTQRVLLLILNIIKMTKSH